MYKTAALVFLLLLLSKSIYAQKFDGGITGAILGSQIDGDFLGGYNKLGVSFGAWVSHPLSEPFTLKAELRYIQKGKTKPAVPDEGIISETTRLNYMQIPILLHYNLPNQWYLEGGLGLGYLFGITFLEGGVKLDEDSYPLDPDDFYDAELCVLLGIGYSLTENIDLSIRFTNDIFAIADVSDAVGTQWWTDPGKLYNKTIELTLAYKIDL